METKIPQLKELYLSKNQINTVSIGNLTHLEKLDLSYNQITKIKNLENLPQLKILNLEENPLEKMFGLEKLTQLKKLNLGNTQITKIEGMSNLINLEEFIFWGKWGFKKQKVPLENLEALGVLPNLKKLTIGTQDLYHIPNLMYGRYLIELRHNHQFSDRTGIRIADKKDYDVPGSFAFLDRLTVFTSLMSQILNTKKEKKKKKLQEKLKKLRESFKIVVMTLDELINEYNLDIPKTEVINEDLSEKIKDWILHCEFIKRLKLQTDLQVIFYKS
ncbi:MAG: leucine-rich repeat domain-containing protein [Candidatus Helarchaeota archaeon]|nr:leucine-rich repeat domain-containing protein [Candidatus Helarchaeota archaeon]